MNYYSSAPIIAVYKRFEAFVNFPTLNSEMDKCWSKMIRVRSNYYCPVCSGRSHQFLGGEKVLLSEDICRETMGDCVQSLNWIFTMVEMLGSTFGVFGDQITSGRVHAPMTSSMLLVLGREIVKKGLENESIVSIRNYLSSNTSNNTAELADFCSKGITLSQTTFIKKVSLAYEILASIFVHFNIEFKKIFGAIMIA